MAPALVVSGEQCRALGAAGGSGTMTAGAISRDDTREDAAASRLVKKVRISPSGDAGARLEHPFGVKPIGNYYEDAAHGVVECRGSGLGRLACLSDFQLLALLNFLTAEDLARLSESSRACYIFGRHDELWRTLVLEEMEGAFYIERDWRRSYIATKYPKWTHPSSGSPVKVQGFYSDLLFQPFYCAAAPIEDSWLAIENIDRRAAAELTLDKFRSEYEMPNKPVIITGAVDHWQGLHKWTDKYLSDASEGQTFSAGGFQFPMERYLRYSRSLVDDQPLFIFDKEFVAKVPAFGDEYSVPEYFQQDFFSLLGADMRPDYRWLIIGPKKSGSSFHVDPNATNAWNSIIRGAKKWIMFPPEVVPPGVHPSEDGGDVSSPVSLMEWFVTFYSQVRKLPAHLKPLEGICREGETMFVPHGWWHLVLNIEESIAITQNFVSAGNLKSVMRFLQEKPDQVSGCPMERRPLMAGLFRDAMANAEPELFARVDKELKDEYEKKHRKSKWEQLVEGGNGKVGADDEPASTSSATFGFGFQFD